MADRFSPSVSRALQDKMTYGGLFPEVSRFFKASRRPCVFVVEDLHWADAGTLDLLRYLGRRLHGLPLLMLLTHRENGVDDDYPLRFALGDPPSATTLCIVLAPLARDAVEALARAAHKDGPAIYAATAGNPFFVTEMLAAERGSMPASVPDAVRSTLARLPKLARTPVEWVSLFPGRAEQAVLTQLKVIEASAVDACKNGTRGVGLCDDRPGL